MKKFKYVIAFLLVALLFPITTYAAGGVTSNKTSLTITEGSSATFVIKATNAAGKVTVSSSNKSIATVNKSSTWLENASLTVTVKGLKVGSTTVKVVVDAATFDEEVEISSVLITAAKNPQLFPKEYRVEAFIGGEWTILVDSGEVKEIKGYETIVHNFETVKTDKIRVISDMLNSKDGEYRMELSEISAFAKTKDIE